MASIAYTRPVDSPEKALWATVIQQALFEARTGNYSSRQFFYSKDFEFLASHLGLVADDVRRAL